MHDTRLVICDWSGVISDDRKIVHECNMLMCADMGVPLVSYDEWLPSVGLSVNDWYAARGVTHTADEVIAAYEAAFKVVHAKGVRPSMYPDAKIFLERATANRSAVVVSAHPQAFLEAEADAYGIDQFFSQLQGSLRSKTDAILTVLAQLNIAPEACVMIGDTTSDMRHAKAAGVRTVGITTGYHTRGQLEAENPSLIVESLTELAESF